ncbi:hypothetical protein M0804_003281 [Polistes exclamans]|nr:hypothetical protein M0804_003281 [Polistes exclamans]
MLQIAIVIVGLAVVSVDHRSTAEDVADLSESNLDVPAAAMKLDKNLRRALLKALTDLEAESVEQRKNNDEPIAQAYTSNQFQDISKKDLNKKIGIVQKSSFSFDGFPGDEEIPSEDKLQNSSFVQTDKYVIMSSSPSMTIEKATRNDARSFHVQNIIMSDKNQALKVGPKMEQLETKKSNGESYVSYVNKVDSITLKPLTELTEGLTGVASNGIALANSLPLPKPTASSPTDSPKINDTLMNGSKVIEKSEEVKIFQAPLVAAFTVQQDESGAPKSVVPIFKPTGDGQALTLQEQLEFKQRLLEKQLEELQQQQLQQTQFLIRQRHLYEQQLRQKQQQQYYLQEQARIKQIEEQAKLKQLEEQRLKQFEEQRLKQFEDPRILRFQQQPVLLQQQPVPLQQQKYRFFEQATNLLNIPTPAESNVRLQPTSTRFNRQEAFNSVGNFGFNEKPLATRNTFTFGVPQRNPINFVYNPYTHNQYRQTRPQQTPAKQIQHLLYQSGIAGELGNAEGSGGQEDLNIVSKVLALNVGAIPNKNLHFTTNNRVNNGFVAKVPANA